MSPTNGIPRTLWPRTRVSGRTPTAVRCFRTRSPPLVFFNGLLPPSATKSTRDQRSAAHGPAVTSSLRVVRHEALRRPGVPSVRFPVFPRYRGHLGNGARARREIETPRLKSRPGHVVCPTAGGVTAMFIGKTAVGRAPAGGPSGVCSVLSESAVKRPTFSRHSYDGSTGTQRLCY